MGNTDVYNVATEETYHDGQVIFNEGSFGDWIYIILSGSVEISKTVKGEKKIIETLQAGELFGELGFIGRIKRTATAKAVGVTSVGIIDREFLDNEFNKLSAQFRTILVAVTNRFVKMLDRASDFTTRAEPRIPKVLSMAFKDRKSFVRAYTKNIGAGGLSIKTENPLPPGHQFLLKLEISGMKHPMQIKCEVLWSHKRVDSTPEKPSGMGVKFCEIPEKDYLFLKKYISGTTSDE